MVTSQLHFTYKAWAAHLKICMNIIFFLIYEYSCIRPGPLGCRVGRVVAHHMEGLMAAMWKGVEIAILIGMWVLVVMVGITREIGSVMDTLCGKQRL